MSKDTQLNIRISDIEKKEIEALALKTGLNRAEFIRYKIFKQESLNSKIDSLFEEANREMRQRMIQQEDLINQSLKNTSEQIEKITQDLSKKMEEEYEQRFKQYTNHLFKKVIENVNEVLAVNDRKVINTLSTKIEDEIIEKTHHIYKKIEKLIKGGE